MAVRFTAFKLQGFVNDTSRARDFGDIPHHSLIPSGGYRHCLPRLLRTSFHNDSAPAWVMRGASGLISISSRTL
jgi:hypothetical protein